MLLFLQNIMYTDGQNGNRTWKKWKGVKRCQGNICCFACGDKVPNHKSKWTSVKRVDVISDIDIEPETPLFFLLITKNYPSWKKNKIHHNPFTRGFFYRLYIVSFSSWNVFFFVWLLSKRHVNAVKNRDKTPL